MNFVAMIGVVTNYKNEIYICFIQQTSLMNKYLLTITTIVLGLFQLGWVYAPARKTPFGTQYIKTMGYYVDKREICISDWRQFCYVVRTISGDTAVSFYTPDTNAIIKRYGSNIFTSRSNAYKDSIVVGLTPAQIEQYCKFRTWAVQQVKSGFSALSYSPLDSAMYASLTSVGSTAGVKAIASDIPELVRYESEYKIHINKDSAIHYQDFKGVFGFRCVARYK